LVVEYPNPQLSDTISKHPDYQAYSYKLKQIIINGMQEQVIQNCRSAMAMCENIRNLDNKVIETAIIKYIHSLDITNPIILHIIDNMNKDLTWTLCGLYDTTIACKIVDYNKQSLN
jgi:hypothetical protein